MKQEERTRKHYLQDDDIGNAQENVVRAYAPEFLRVDFTFCREKKRAGKHSFVILLPRQESLLVGCT